MNQIFLAPQLKNPVEYLGTLVHELVHAVDNCSSKHRAGFKKIAKDVGLTGPMRSAGVVSPLIILITLGKFHLKLFLLHIKIIY